MNRFFLYALFKTAILIRGQDAGILLISTKALSRRERFFELTNLAANIKKAGM